MEEYKDNLNPIIRNFALELMENNLLIEENKKDIILYLYFVLSTIINQDYVANINTIDEFNKIRFIRNDNNYTIGINNKKILKNIRNAFAHGSSQIKYDKNTKELIIFNQTKFGDRISKFEIRITKEDLIQIFSKSTANYLTSDNQLTNIIMNAISSIQKNEPISENQKVSQIALLSLMFCYNKESLLDKYLSSQQSFLNCSNFEIKTTENWEDSEVQNQFFRKYELLYFEEKDKEKCRNDWQNYIEEEENDKDRFIYNTENQSVDITTGKHIPTPILMMHLRNATSHGYVEYQGDKIIFYDRKKRNQPPYIKISISNEKLNEFLKNDIFYESLFTQIETFENARDTSMYFFERAESANNFRNFINIYLMRFPNLSEKQVIWYLLKTNKLATFILEHPEQYDNFCTYKINSREKLIDYLVGIEDFTSNQLEHINEYIYDKGIIENFIIKDHVIELMEDVIIKQKNRKFFELYFIFLYNKNRTKNMLLYEKIPENKKKLVDDGSKALEEKFFKSGAIKNLMDNDIIMQEIAMTLYPKNFALNLFNALAIADRENRKNRNIPRKFTVENVERYSTEESIIEQTLEKEKNRNKVSRIISMATGITLIITSILLIQTNQIYSLPAIGLFIAGSGNIAIDIYKGDKIKKNIEDIQIFNPDKFNENEGRKR